MEELPIQCTARFNEITRRADSLAETFKNGNRKDLLEALLDMEPKAALAVLAEIMYDQPLIQPGLHRFLKEMA